MTEYRPDVCIYHKDCNDGFGAAYAVWERFGDYVTYVPMSYGDEVPVDVAGKHVMFVDFSLKSAELKALGANTVLVLDHHKTAESELEEFVIEGSASTALIEDIIGIYKDLEELEAPKIIAAFDMGKSGARLAWEFCHPNHRIPDLLEFIEDRDLWRNSHEWTRPVYYGLKIVPRAFHSWAAIDLGQLILQGQAIASYVDQLVKEFLVNVHHFDMIGTTVPAVCVPDQFSSDVGHALLKAHPTAPFAMTWFSGVTKTVFSLRSEDNREDVSEVAKIFGGGGLRNAAGFSLVNAPENMILTPPA